MLEIGTKAPAFALPDQNGTVHTLEEYRGKKVILYFYPKDNTSGCTKQACGFPGSVPAVYGERSGSAGRSARTVRRPIKSLRKNTACPSRCCLIRSFPASKPMMCGRRKICMGKRPWEWCVPSYACIDEEGIIVKAFGKVKAADNPAQMLGEL